MPRPGPNNNSPQFRNKSVFSLQCRFCDNNVCTRGMRALLLADNRIELFSTDVPSLSRIQVVGSDYTTHSCRCKICNVACLGCGNEIGYHITQPCAECLKACNNGHFWMFLTDCVRATEKRDSKSQRVLLWANLPSESEWDENYYWINANTMCR